ncbi:MAG TPA: GON domain-containing protein [Anaeromyxobacter sp.]
MNVNKLLAPVLGALVVIVISSGRATALENPKSCNEIYLRGGTVDGDYVIEPAPGVVFTVYCKDLSSGIPKDYITLSKTGGDFNFSQATGGGCHWGTNVRTSFTKIRIDPKSLLVDIADLTFATSTGQLTDGYGVFTQVEYGVATDCAGSATGLANIDLRDTPFEVSSDFAAEGYAQAGSANGIPLVPNVLTLVSGRIVNLTGGGYGGMTGPEGFNSTEGSWQTALYAGAPYVPKPALKLVYKP